MWAWVSALMRLNNVLSFQSAYQGTNADASVSYKTLVIKPGIVPQIGFVTPASKKVALFYGFKMQIIPLKARGGLHKR
jgi:hypothetical protein